MAARSLKRPLKKLKGMVKTELVEPIATQISTADDGIDVKARKSRKTKLEAIVPLPCAVRATVGKEWKSLQTPPTELRPEIVLCNGQSFAWAKCDENEWVAVVSNTS